MWRIGSCRAVLQLAHRGVRTVEPTCSPTTMVSKLRGWNVHHRYTQPRRTAATSAAPSCAIAAQGDADRSRGAAQRGSSTAPSGVRRVLLHSCCAPCSGAMVEEMQAMGLDVCIYFYNPNIHPREEYEIRKEENKRFAEKRGIPFVDADYDHDKWFKRARGMEHDPERGSRCTMCFDMRMERTALYAHENGYDAFTTTNATSRWKDKDQVNGSGLRAADAYENVKYWVYDWQSDAMTDRKYEINAEEAFYKQEYCGCLYSLRDTNIYRQANGIPPVKIGGETAGLGTRYFQDPVMDAAEESVEVVEGFFKSANKGFVDERKTLYKHRRKKTDNSRRSDNNW